MWRVSGYYLVKDSNNSSGRIFPDFLRAFSARTGNGVHQRSGYRRTKSTLASQRRTRISIIKEEPAVTIPSVGKPTPSNGTRAA